MNPDEISSSTNAGAGASASGAGSVVPPALDFTSSETTNLSMADSLASAADNLTSAGMAAKEPDSGSIDMGQIGASDPSAQMERPNEPLIPAAPVPGSIGSAVSGPAIAAPGVSVPGVSASMGSEPVVSGAMGSVPVGSGAVVSGAMGSGAMGSGSMAGNDATGVDGFGDTASSSAGFGATMGAQPASFGTAGANDMPGVAAGTGANSAAGAGVSAFGIPGAGGAGASGMPGATEASGVPGVEVSNAGAAGAAAASGVGAPSEPYNPFAAKMGTAAGASDGNAQASSMNVPTGSQPVTEKFSAKSSGTAGMKKPSMLTVALGILAAVSLVMAIVFAVLWQKAEANKKVANETTIPKEDEVVNHTVAMITCTKGLGPDEAEVLAGLTDHNMVATVSFSDDQLGSIAMLNRYVFADVEAAEAARAHLDEMVAWYGSVAETSGVTAGDAALDIADTVANLSLSAEAEQLAGEYAALFGLATGEDGAVDASRESVQANYEANEFVCVED